MRQINNCEVCGKHALAKVLDLGSHPLCDDLIPVGSPIRSEEYLIEILFCEQCKTAHQKFQVPKDNLFTKDYHYRARMTGSVLEGMKDLVDSCEKKLGSLKDKVVLDIGCNDGSLLDFFSDKGSRTIGVEPTGASQDSKHETINSFFDANCVSQLLDANLCPDIITFTNVFAHIEDLKGLINNLKKIMTEKTLLVIENHYIGSVLEYGQFDTFYHEHPRTYSLESFKYIARSLNRKLNDVQFVSRYGGNIRVFISNKEASRTFLVDESFFHDYFRQMSGHVEQWKIETKKMICELVERHGPLRAKAFPGRAAILIKLLDLETTLISAVYEITGSIKVNHYVPGTRIPILPEADLYEKQDQSKPILNLAWHIPKEVRNNLARNGYRGDVYDIKIFKSFLKA